MDSDGKSDPYIKVDVDGFCLQQTKVVSKNLNPEWDEKFIFTLSPQQVCVVCSLYLSVVQMLLMIL
jgi:Ca2+-dependent lipid-binding protein